MIGSPLTLKKEILADPFNEGLLHFTSSLTTSTSLLTLSLIVIESVIVKTKASGSQPSDPRFEITIIGPQNETAQFKTRGGHPVRKVLAAACRTFGIKYERCVVLLIILFLFPSYPSLRPNRSRLILCVSFEEGGKIQTDEFDCPAEETMSQCGVDGNSKLFVRVEPDIDEVYEED